MPEPLPDVNREHDCYHYQAPSGQRCGSPALKGEYYCYHHLVKTNYKKNNRVLIDPEVTRMEIPVIEDRASIFLALAAVIHRLAENTIDTQRAGQMIYGLQVAMRALEPPRSQRAPAANTTTKPGAPEPALSSSKGSSPLHRDDPGVTHAPDPEAGCPIHDGTTVMSGVRPTPQPATANQPGAPSELRSGGIQPATDNQQPATPTTIPITKESLLYFLRSRHCASCNAELFPAEELTERPNPGAPPEVIEEARPALPAPPPATENLQPATVLPTLHAVAENPPRGVVPRNPINPGSFLPPIILSNRSMIGGTLRLGSRLTTSFPEAER